MFSGHSCESSRVYVCVLTQFTTREGLTCVCPIAVFTVDFVGA